MNETESLHKRALAATNVDELGAVYDCWADQYDVNLIDDLDYVAPKLASQRLIDALPDRKSIILDAGCGTGLVGEHLRAAGYETIDGVDYSQAMIEKARSKNVYRSIRQADLTRRLTIDDAAYDAIICVGTLTLGHVGPGVFSEFVRISVDGGLICVTVREEAWEAHNYSQHIAELEAQSRWRTVDKRRCDYIRQEGSRCLICLFEVTRSG